MEILWQNQRNLNGELWKHCHISSFNFQESAPLSCIITGGPAPILRSVNEVSPKKWRILMKNDAISMTTGP
jgi:hypothetical protein